MYYNLTFNSFSRALVVLMALIVVNNWHVITKMYVYASGTPAKAYFIFVYVAGVVVMMNVLSAFILDVFMNSWEKYKQFKEEKKETHLVQSSSISGKKIVATFGSCFV